MCRKYRESSEAVAKTYIESRGIGGREKFEKIKALANGNKDIILTGLRTDVADILKCSDVFVGVSRAALEAMSCELPVILAGNKDYAQGFMGIFDENKKEQAISTNFCCRNCTETKGNLLLGDIIKVYNMNDQKRDDLGKYGRNIVKEYYSIEKMTDDAENMYKKVLTK